jgi:hypothetical protein
MSRTSKSLAGAAGIPVAFDVGKTIPVYLAYELAKQRPRPREAEEFSLNLFQLIHTAVSEH